MSNLKKADFTIVIDFDKNSQNPARVFQSMAMLIGAFETFDKELVRHLDNRIETVMLLEDIEIGSLKSWLASVISKIPDEGLADLDWKKAVGHYLVKAKYIVLNKLEGKVKLTDDAREIEVIEMELLEAAKETGVNQLPTYVPTSKKTIINHIDRLANAVESLTDKDSVEYQSEFGKATFNVDFSIDMDAMEELLSAQTIDTESQMILKVKKPDYLGDSKWSFKHGTDNISAKISDADWLTRFQNRKIDVRPQDSLVCRVRIKVRYDNSFEVISKSYEVLEVIKINQRPESGQLKLHE